MLVDDRLLTLAKLMDVAHLRARVHAGNLANQNTPGYQPREVQFEDDFRKAVRRGGTSAGLAVEASVVTAPGTPGNDGNAVNLDREVTLMAQNQTLYTTYAAILRGRSQIYQTATSGGGGG